MANDEILNDEDLALTLSPEYRGEGRRANAGARGERRIMRCAA